MTYEVLGMDQAENIFNRIVRVIAFSLLTTPDPLMIRSFHPFHIPEFRMLLIIIIITLFLSSIVP